MIDVPTEIIAAINSAHKIGIMTHLNGDGDAFSSLLGLRNILQKLNKTVVVFSNEALPPYFDYLAKDINYLHQDEYENIDLLIGLDLVSVARFTVPKIFKTAQQNHAKTVIIDHHTEGEIHRLADYSWRNQVVSSTAELIYWFTVKQGIKLDKLTAQLLLMGLEHDTYFLTNQNVYPSTREAQKGLWGYGADTDIIKKEVEAASPTNNLILMKQVERRITVNQGVLFTYITDEDKRQAGLLGENISSVISSYFDTQKKPRVSVAAEQRSNDWVKVSLRSNNSEVDVAAISKKYGGGGHIHAAGFELKGKLIKYIESGFFEKLSLEIS